ncbi:MAG: UbiA family prenyltransferase [Moraxella sp.]
MTTHTLSFKDKLQAYIHLTRFDKPVGIELVFWSTLWAVFLAAKGFEQFPPGTWWQSLRRVVLMRAAGCAINDFADRKVDGHVSRTVDPLAEGRLTGKEAVWTFLILSWVSAALLVFLPVQVFIWSFGAVALAFIYPFMKRFTHLPQVFLAAAFGWAIPDGAMLRYRVH